jgi:Na+/melibiose symporter-like transporter
VHRALAGLLISCVAFPAAVSSIGVRLWLRSPRPLIIIGTAGIAVACALLGFATMPGIIPSESARHGFALASLAGFFVSLDAFVAPTFYELALSTQHRSVRSSAGAFLNSFVTLTSMVDMLLYPVAVNGLSGGEGGNQLRGYAIVSFFHGAVAVACAVAMWRWLHPARNNLDKGGEDSPQHDDSAVRTHNQASEFSPRPGDDSGTPHPA